MKITKKEFLDILEEKEACSEAIKWVKENKAETFIELWNTCEQADWMLWILARMAGKKEWPSRKTVVLCACDCAETALQFVPEKENRPKIAIQTARKWAEGKASKIECKKAADAGHAAYHAAYAASAAAANAAFASSAASYAASYAASSSAAFYAAYDAADAAAAAANAAASYDDYVAFAAYVAEKEALKNMADIIRKRVNF
jgi:hypothetical protein